MNFEITMNIFHVLIIILPLILLRICSNSQGRKEFEEKSDLEPICANLHLSSRPQLSFLSEKEKKATFNLGNNEQSYTTFRLAAQKFEGVYYILAVNLRFNCSVLINMKDNRVFLLHRSKQRFRVKLGASVDSVWCFCGRSDQIDECPSHAECLSDESNDISLARQCGRGYQQPFCGSCGFGYLVMRPGDYYPITDPHIQSVTMGRGCHLWNGDRKIDTRPPGNVNIDRTKSLFCNCSGDQYDGYFSSNTTRTEVMNYATLLTNLTTKIPFHNQDVAEFSSHMTKQNTNLATYILVTLAVIVLLIGGITLVYIFRREIHFTRDNSVRGVKVIPPNEIEVVNEVTAGRFGVIRIVKWNSLKCILKSAAQRTVVTVTLPRHPQSGMYSKLLLQELQILNHIGEHTNIVKILGIVNGLVFGTSLVLEYCENGDLKSYLQNRVNQARFMNIPTQNGNEPLTSTSLLHLDRIRHILNSDDCFSTFTLLKWSMEIASGTTTDNGTLTKEFQFLGQRSVVHVDLAARNILLTIDNIVKIADFGLSKILAGPSEEFVQVGINDEENLFPLRWMGPEGSSGRFSIKSDVWSFGITLWEIYSLGEDPYHDILDDRLPEMLRNGYRMSAPTYASNAIYEKLLECWKIEQSERPGFQTLKLFFTNEIVLMRGTLERIVNDEGNTRAASSQPTITYVPHDEL